MTRRNALVWGATGLVGSYLVRLLVDAPEYEQITVVVRRAMNIQHPKIRQVVIDFDGASGLDTDTHGAVQDVFCCLGTTMRKAGSEEAFYKVDYTYSMQAAEFALRHGAKQFLLVSASGADATSRIYYNRVKGSLEDALRKMPFERLVVVRPSLLLGNRAEFRLGERIAILLGKVVQYVMVGPLKRVRPIPAEHVAKGLVWLALHPKKAQEIVENEVLLDIE